MAFVARFVILNGHLAVIIDPQFTDDDIVDGRGHFAPCVMTLHSGARRSELVKGALEDSKEILTS